MHSVKSSPFYNDEYSRSSSIQSGPIKLFVTRVHRNVDSGELWALFSKQVIGKPISFFKKDDPDINKLYTYALVEYETMEEAQNAIRELHNTKPMCLNVTIAESDEEKAERKKKQAKKSTRNSSCLKCQKPTEFVCGGCGSGYCSKNCQKADWPEHKSDCLTKSGKLSTIPGKHSNNESFKKIPVSCKPTNLEEKDVNQHNLKSSSLINGKPQSPKGLPSCLSDNVTGGITRNKSPRAQNSVQNAYSLNNVTDAIGQLNILPSSHTSKANSNFKKTPNNNSPPFNSININKSCIKVSEVKYGSESLGGNTGSLKSGVMSTFPNYSKGIKNGEVSSEEAERSSLGQFVPVKIPVYEFPVGIHKIKILNADSPSSLVIKTTNCDHLLEDIKSQMNNLLSLAVEEIVPDMFCVVIVSGLTCSHARAIVIEVLQDESVFVRLIDFGKQILVKFTDCFAMPEPLLLFPALVISAKVAGIKPLSENWSSDSLSTFEQLLGSEGEVDFHGEACGVDTSGVLSLKLYDSNDPSTCNEIGNLMLRLKVAKECKVPVMKSAQTICGLKKLPFVSLQSIKSSSCNNLEQFKLTKFVPSNCYDVKDEVSLTLVHSTATSFWFMTLNEASPEQISFLKSISLPEFQQCCDNSPPLSNIPSRGDVVAVFSPSLKSWYRACILDEFRKEVFYIDYGNTEVVEDFRQLDERYHIPALSWSCKVCDLDEGTVKLLKSSEDDLVTATVTSVDEEGMLLTCEGKSFKLVPWSKVLSIESLLGHVRKANGPDKRLTLSDVAARNKIPKICGIKLIFCKNPQHSVVHLDSDADDLIILTAAISIHHKNACRMSYKPKLNELVASQYVDKEWYRAVVLSVNEDEATVNYIDYGNTKTVPFSHIQKLNPNLLGRVFGVQVRLEGVSATVATEHFTQFVAQFYDQSYMMEVIKEGPIPTVRIYNGEVDLNKSFLGFSSPPQEVSAPTILKMSDCNFRPWIPMKGKSVKIKINHVFDECLKLSAVCVSHESEMEQFMQQVQGYCKDALKIKSRCILEDEQLCFALNTNTKRFERACLLKMGRTKHFFFIDTGYYLPIDSSRIIPFSREFLDYPVNAVLAKIQDWDQPFGEEKDLVLGPHNVIIHDVEPDNTPVFRFNGLH